MNRTRASAVSSRSRLVRLIATRVAVATLLLGAGTLVQIRAQGIWPVDPFFSLLGLTYALSIGYLFTVGLATRHRWLVDLQFGLDAFTISALVLVTGGVNSLFTTLYALPIVAASTLQNRRGGVLVGVLSSVVYSGIVLAQYLGTEWLIPVTWLPDVTLPPLRQAVYTVVMDGAGFMGVAVLSGFLADRVQRANERLRVASDQIADLQAFNQHVIDSLTSGLLTTDTTGHILTLNPAAEGILGRPAPDFVGERVFDVLPLSAAFELAVLEGSDSVHSTEMVLARATGDRIDLTVSAARLASPTEGGLLFVCDDVTDARRMERESRMQQRLAAVGEMAAGIAHEIRNPLASMSGSIQILRDELPLNGEQEQLMEIVLRESERLNETIRTFLAYAHPRRLEVERVDLRQVVRDTAMLLRHGAEATDQHTIDIGAESAPVWCEADRNQLQQIVWNLATNALKAMPGGGHLRIAVSADSPERVELRVADEGVGIPADEIGQVFQPFRSHSGTGTGLGLSIVHRIVSDYGGRIRIDSKEGSGTTVTVSLPAKVRDIDRRDAARTPLHTTTVGGNREDDGR